MDQSPVPLFNLVQKSKRSNSLFDRRKRVQSQKNSDDEDSALNNYLNTIRQKQGIFTNHIQIYGLKKQFLEE